MKLELYFVAAGIIGVMLFRVHSHFNGTYSGKQFYQEKVSKLQEDLDRSELEVALMEKRQFDYQQSIAMQLPSMLKKDPYNARNIASVISDKKGAIEFDNKFEKLEAAKKYFNEGHFEEVVDELEPIYKDSPEHPLAPEVSFLLMEANHFLGKREEAAVIIRSMLQLYPESYLTGYALLRLAEYFVQEGDERKAKYLYQFISEKFNYDPQIVKSATEGLRRVRDGLHN
ncbi:MAG: hypothetical protein KDD37_04260 [Bdellovibrionales bacterium]|nr:hypothetical protein [Bdellovibrionales bacterium]